MSAEIVKFPKDPSRKAEERHVKLEYYKREVVRNARAAAVQDREFGREEEVSTAQELDRLIAQAKKRRITQPAISRALAMKQIKIRHLERMRIDHELSPPEAKRKLTSSPPMARRFRHSASLQSCRHRPSDGAS
jgi:hypothetical protein